jgi:hypothetical protein
MQNIYIFLLFLSPLFWEILIINFNGFTDMSIKSFQAIIFILTIKNQHLCSVLESFYYSMYVNVFIFTFK